MAVRIKDEPELRLFQRTWKFHNPLRDEQLAYAGHTTTVQEVGFYHGADALYVLTGVPGLWHEQCLLPASPVSHQDQVTDDHASRALQQSAERSNLQSLDRARSRSNLTNVRRDLLIGLAAAGLSVLLAAGVSGARVLERDFAGFHGPVGLLALAPAVVLYAVGALLLLVVWKKNRHTTPTAVVIAALAPTVVLVILTLRSCWLIAVAAG